MNTSHRKGSLMKGKNYEKGLVEVEMNRNKRKYEKRNIKESGRWTASSKCYIHNIF